MNDSESRGPGFDPSSLKVNTPRVQVGRNLIGHSTSISKVDEKILALPPVVKLISKCDVNDTKSVTTGYNKAISCI